jgi:hypothetical protein
MSAATIHDTSHRRSSRSHAGVSGAAPASAQSKPQPRASSASRGRRGASASAATRTFGNIFFTAAESFDAILGTTSGPIFGGGARVGLPWGGLFVDVGAWRFHAEGDRALVFEDEVIPLGIPVDVTGDAD